MAYKVFTNGSVLNASEVNDNLMNQAVITFTNSTARASAITSPVEGMLTYLADTNLYQFWNGTAWTNLVSTGPVGKVLQVVSVNPGANFTSTSTSFVDATGFTATITPSAATSQVLVLINNAILVNGTFTNTNCLGYTRIVRGATALATQTYGKAGASSSHELYVAGTQMILDTPATTSATTYKLQVSVNPGSSISARTSASIVLMEIGA